MSSCDFFVNSFVAIFHEKQTTPGVSQWKHHICDLIFDFQLLTHELPPKRPVTVAVVEIADVHLELQVSKQTVLKSSVCDISPKKITVGQINDGETESVTMESSHFNHRPPHRTNAMKCPCTCCTNEVTRYFDPCTGENICSSTFRTVISIISTYC